ncbi:MAG: ornithine carbamoyltransferase [Candidatus Omnitrophota bacterium]
MKKDLLTIKDLSAKDIAEIFALTQKIKANKNKFTSALKGKSVGLIFQKPSNRTRVSFEVGVWELGGHCIYLGPDEINLGQRETAADVARTLSRYLSAIVARTFSHETVEELASYAAIPVINGLSDFSHPCQALADVFTIKEKKKSFKVITLAYIGDGNNVCHSLLMAAAKVGLNIRIATPEAYAPDAGVVAEARSAGQGSGAKIALGNEPTEAAKNADVIYTDVWASMGQEAEAEKRKKDFAGFQVNSPLTALAKKDYLFMHCLPAHRGQEVGDEIMDSQHSIVFDQAENRLHVQKAILIWILGKRDKIPNHKFQITNKSQ